jgi:hypothetical protein
MRSPLVAGAAFAALFAVSSIVAQSLGGSPPNSSKSGTSGADVRPGSVGPGSEKNSQVSPTSPTIPMDAQPPGDIPANSGSSGASTGESGSPGPYNPTEPQK